MPRLSCASSSHTLFGILRRSAHDIQIWDSCRQAPREPYEGRCRKFPGPVGVEVAPLDESTRPSIQVYFEVPRELPALNRQPAPAATPECTTEVELWASVGWGPIACKGWETKHVKKITSSIL